MFNVSKVTQRTPKLSVSSRGIGPKLGSFFGHYDPRPVGLVTSFVHACGLSFNHFLLRISAVFLQGAVEYQICCCQLLQHLKCVCLHNMGVWLVKSLSKNICFWLSFITKMQIAGSIFNRLDDILAHEYSKRYHARTTLVTKFRQLNRQNACRAT